MHFGLANHLISASEEFQPPNERKMPQEKNRRELEQRWYYCTFNAGIAVRAAEKRKGAMIYFFIVSLVQEGKGGDTKQENTLLAP